MPFEVYLFAAGLIVNVATLWVTRGMRRVDSTQTGLQEHDTRITRLESAFDLMKEMLRRSELQSEKLEVKLDRLLDRP